MSDRDYMLRAIELAERGRGFTNPNPIVGAVVVKNNRIIGEGYHERYGELHAERNALASLIEPAEGATIYVTLEPCCHYGKTPPCTEAIIEHKLARVVIGSRDPNPKVAGGGIARLREAGIEVVEDFMREECDELNPVFFKYITTSIPYVVMKFAMTLDGKIATRTGESKWVSNEKSRSRVHHMRHEYSAIMVGINTVLADDPMLNTRIKGLTSPVRVICDSSLRIPLDSRIVKTARDYRTIVATCSHSDKCDQLEEQGVEILQCSSIDGRPDLKELLTKLGDMKIDSILVEGGGTLNFSLLETGSVDEVIAFIAPKLWGGEAARTPVSGRGFDYPADGTRLELLECRTDGEDIMARYRVRKGDL